VNFFFVINSSILHSKLSIPRFQNSAKSNNKYDLFQAVIDDGSWAIKNITKKIISDKDFYFFESDAFENNGIFFLAKKNDFLDIKKNSYSKLSNFNNLTDTSPAFRSNLQVFLSDGGFSSYQSEYPSAMVSKKGSILSPINSLSNRNADKNIIFLMNIYELPIHEKFNLFFINIKSKKILKKVKVSTNCLNEVIIDKNLIQPDVFLFTDKFIGIPIFCSIKNNHISFEHSHPPHSFVMSNDKFKVISELKKEINEFIN
jgi:hypothetical protein